MLLFLVLYFRARDSNNRSIGEIRQFLDNIRNDMELRFQDILEDLEKRSVDMQTERDFNIEYMRRGAQSYQNFIQRVEGLEATQERLEDLFNIVHKYEEELDQIEQQIEQQFGRVSQQVSLVHKLDGHLKEQRTWAEKLQKHLFQELNEHGDMLQGNFEEYLVSKKQSLENEFSQLDHRLQELKSNAVTQEEMLQKIHRSRQEWDKVEHALQADAKSLRQSQENLQEKLQHILQQNSQMEDKVEVRRSQLQESLDRLDQDYQDLQVSLEHKMQQQKQEFRESLEQNIQNLQHQLQEQMSEKAEVLMNQTIEQMHQQLQEVEQWFSTYFEKFSDIEIDIKKDRKVLLEQFRAEMEREVEAMRESYREQANDLLGDWNTLSEKHQRLQADLQHIENRSRDELNAGFELYEKNFTDTLRKKQNDLNERLQLWEENLKKKLEEQSAEMELTQQEDWERSRQLWDKQIEAERRNLKEYLRTSKQQIQGYENESMSTTRELMEEIRSEIKALQDNLVQQNNECDAEIRKRLEEYSNKLGQWYKKFQQAEKDIQERSHKLEQHCEAMDTRLQADVQQMMNNVQTIEQQQQHVLDNAKLIERAEQLWRETREQIAKLREQNSVLSTYVEQSKHLSKEFDYIRQRAQDVGEKLQDLAASEEQAETLQQNIYNLAETLEQSQNKWEAMYAQNDRLQQIEESLHRIEEAYQERGREFLASEERAQSLEARQAQVLQHVGDVQDIQAHISSLEQLAVPLEKKLHELSHLQSVLEKNLGPVDQVVGQIAALEELLEAAQKQGEEFQRMRSWLLEAEERVQNMGEELEANIHLAEQITLQQANSSGSFGDSSADLARIDEETRKMVLQLREKGWDNHAIAKNLNISISAVEMILEMSSMV